MGRVRKSLVQKLLRAADSPIFDLPKSWHVLSRYRTAELFLKHPAPPVVRFNDAAVYKRLMRDFPQVKLQPLRLNSAQPSLATKLIAEQQQLAGFQPQQSQHQPQQPQPAARQPDQWLPFGVQPQQESGVQVVEVQRGDHTNRWSMSHKLKQELDQAGKETSTGGYLEFIQQQEEESLQAALHKLKQQEAASQS